MNQTKIETAMDLLAKNLEYIHESEEQLADVMIESINEVFGRTVNSVNCVADFRVQANLKGTGLLFKPACDIEGELDWLKPAILDYTRQWLEQKQTKPE